MTANDLQSFWMPFTDNRYFKANPRFFARADGMYYYRPDGQSVLDATAGLWCVNAGHCRPKIVEAIRDAAGELDYAPAFQLGHPLAFALSKRLSSVFPEGFDRWFFCNSGSEAAETALKIALAYQRAIGQGTRTRLIGRERGYHGTNFGGISVGGITANRRAFGALLAGVDHLRHTHDLARNKCSRGQPAHGAELADDLERLVALHGAETIAAVIVEPMAGSTGVLVPPRGYLERLRDIAKKHGIVLIFDEVITAFGRLGPMTASEFYGVTPDILCVAKGLTNGAVPMGAVASKTGIYDAIVGAAPQGIEFFHGYTYSAHPLACAAALATLDVFVQEDLLARASSLSGYFEDAVHSLAGKPHVIDIRNQGLVAAIELEPREGTPRATEIFRAAFDSGLLIRVTGETIALSPPLIISKAEIDQIVEKLGALLDKQA
jgi:beta-alanine--pyruvate transaminase